MTYEVAMLDKGTRVTRLVPALWVLVDMWGVGFYADAAIMN